MTSMPPRSPSSSLTAPMSKEILIYPTNLIVTPDTEGQDSSRFQARTLNGRAVSRDEYIESMAVAVVNTLKSLPCATTSTAIRISRPTPTTIIDDNNKSNDIVLRAGVPITASHQPESIHPPHMTPERSHDITTKLTTTTSTTPKSADTEIHPRTLQARLSEETYHFKNGNQTLRWTCTSNMERHKVDALIEMFEALKGDHELDGGEGSIENCDDLGPCEKFEDVVWMLHRLKRMREGKRTAQRTMLSEVSANYIYGDALCRPGVKRNNDEVQWQQQRQQRGENAGGKGDKEAKSELEYKLRGSPAVPNKDSKENCPMNKPQRRDVRYVKWKGGPGLASSVLSVASGPAPRKPSDNITTSTAVRSSPPCQQWLNSMDNLQQHSHDHHPFILGGTQESEHALHLTKTQKRARERKEKKLRDLR